MTILHRLLEHVGSHGDDTAYIFLENGEDESDRRTFTELLTRAQSVAIGLQEVGLKPGERVLLLFPSGLDFIDSFLGCLLAGIVAVPAYPPRANHSLQRLQDIARDCQASAVLATESVIRQSEVRRLNDPVFSQLPWLTGDSLSTTFSNLSSLDVVYNGSEPVQFPTLERFVGTFAPYGLRREALYPCYGMAEATLMISGVSPVHSPQTQELGAKTLVSCGQTIPDHQVRIVNQDSFEECPTNQIGEIWFRGPSVAVGYWNKPELTQETFNAFLSDSKTGPFLRTGDLGFLDEQGELYVTGRLKDLIIIRGRNHYPHDIERTVEEAHPAVRSVGAAAFSIDVNGTEQLAVVAEVEREYLRRLDVPSVKRTIREAVSLEHEVFAHTIALIKPSALPKTSSGKVQRHACRAALEEGTLARIDEAVVHPKELDT